MNNQALLPWSSGSILEETNIICTMRSVEMFLYGQSGYIEINVAVLSRLKPSSILTVKGIALIIIPNRDRTHQFMMNFSYMWRIRTYVYVYKRPKSEAPDAIFKSRSNQKFYLDNLINTYFQILMNNEIVTDCFS